MRSRNIASSGAASLAALLLSGSLRAQVGSVVSKQKISDTVFGLGGVLEDEDYFGAGVAALGDLDGDGIGELAVGARTLASAGSVWIVFLYADGFVRALQEIGQDFGSVFFNGDLGASVAGIGDLDGDGVPDMAIGAPQDNSAGTSRGAVWICFLNADGSLKASQKIGNEDGGLGFTIPSGANFGTGLAALGDLDGDGAPELAVAAPFADPFGLVYVLSLEANGTVRSHWRIGQGLGGFGGVVRDNDGFATAVANLGDVDGDGVTDLGVGARFDQDGGVALGAAWVVFLGSTPAVKGQQKISATAGGFGGALTSFDQFGNALTSLGDLDGNGVPDLGVGAFWDDDGGQNRGAAWILFLRADGTVQAWQKISSSAGSFGGGLDNGDEFGGALGSFDLDGNGIAELFVGAIKDDDRPSGLPNLHDDRGAVWILHLEGLLRLDFEMEDDLQSVLRNGQDISTPPEFGSTVAIHATGPNAGAAIFDSDVGGPNDPSQDRDLLVGSGNLLILQTNENTTQSVPGVFDRPNDDEDGGSLSLMFPFTAEPKSLALADIDAGADEASLVVLTDFTGRLRVYTIPPGWTGDRLLGQPGRLTLDLTSLAPQAGFASTATAVEDPGFRRHGVVQLELRLGSSGALDDLTWLPSLAAFRQQGPRAQRRGW